MPSDNQALLLQVSADVRGLQKQMAKAVQTVDQSSGDMERRAKRAMATVEDSFANSRVGKASLKLGEEIGDGLRRFTGSAPAAGAALTALGPAGIAAAAGFGAIALALPKVREALDFTDEIADSSAKLHVGVEALQAYRFAAVEAGGEAKDFDTAIEGLSSSLGKFLGGDALGGKKVTKIFDAVGLTREEVGQAQSVEELLPRIADAIHNVSSEAERAAIADKLGVRPLLPLLEQGSAKLAEFTGKARDMGVVIDGQTIRSMSDLQRQVEISSQKIDVDLKLAFLGLAPVLVRIAELAAKVAGSIARIPDAARGLGLGGSGQARPGNDLLDLLPFGLGSAARAVADGYHAAAERGARLNRVDALKAGGAAILSGAPIDTSALGGSLADTLKVPAAAKASGRSGRGSASGADAAARKAEQASRAHDDALADAYRRNEQAYGDETRALLDATTDIQRRAELEAQQLDISEAAKRIAEDKNVADLRVKEKLGDLAAGTADQVATQDLISRATRDRAIATEKATIAARRDADLAAEQQRQSELINGYYDRILQVNLGLARTTEERRAIQLALLASEKKQALAAIENERKAALVGKTPGEQTGVNSRYDAQRASALDQFAAQGREVAQANLGPLAAWADAAPRTAQEVGEAFERYAVRALDDLNGGLADAIAKGESIGDVLASAFRQAETALISYLLKQAEIGLFGGGEGGGGGFLGSLFSSIFHIPAHASGTNFAPGGLSLVGERGPELVNLPRGAQVIPNATLDRLSRMSVPASAPAVTVMQTFQLHSPVVTEDLLRAMDIKSQQARAAAVADARRLVPQDSARRGFYRLPG